MINEYNFYNLEASFKNFLSAGNKKITIKNYLSDFRHFFGWLVLHLKLQSSEFEIIEFRKNVNHLLTTSLINQYKTYLLKNEIPERTINRRLSTVRKFCSFCISQGWMKENPGKHVQNSNLKTTSDVVKTDNSILNQFENDLIEKNLDQPTIASLINDVHEFLSL